MEGEESNDLKDFALIQKFQTKACFSFLNYLGQHTLWDKV